MVNQFGAYANNGERYYHVEKPRGLFRKFFSYRDWLYRDHYRPADPFIDIVVRYVIFIKVYTDVAPLRIRQKINYIFGRDGFIVSADWGDNTWK